MQILAFSSSRVGNSGYLETNAPLIKKFLGDKPMNIAFIPFASVEKNYEPYANNVKNALQNLPHNISVVQHHNAKKIIEQCDIIMVGGGNSFKLLHDIYEQDLLNIIRAKVSAGAPYIGWSAGSNITGLTIATTNDMPIIQPQSFNALAFFNFQINPHYYSQKIPGFNGETRDQRLEEFMKINPEISVLGLPEGSALQLQNNVLQFLGKDPGIIMQTQQKIIVRKEIFDGEDLSHLL